MHLPWWVGPVAIYLLIGWAISALLVLVNLSQIIHRGRTSGFKIANMAAWSLYALPILVAALTLCHVVALETPPMPGWVWSVLGIYSLLVPLMTVYHSVFLARNGRSAKMPAPRAESLPSV